MKYLVSNIDFLIADVDYFFSIEWFIFAINNSILESII